MTEHTNPLPHPTGLNLGSRVALRRGRRFGLRRAGLTLAAFCFTVVGLTAVLATAMFVMLVSGTITVDLSGQIAAALNARVGGGYVFAVGSTAIEETAHGPGLAIGSLSVKDGRGRTIIAAPRASLAVDLPSLLVGRILPKRLELQDLVLRLDRLSDGTMAVSAGADQAADLRLGDLMSTLSGPHEAATPGASAPPAAAGAFPPEAPPHATDLPVALARLVSAISDQLFGDNGPLSAVDRFGIRNGSLIVDDKPRGRSLTYRTVQIDFDREEGGGAYVTAAADGPAGHWSGAARARRGADGARTLDLAADTLSIDEITLLAGFRADKFETDMPLSFSLSAEVGPDGRLRRAGGPISFGTGYFKLDDPDHEPAMIDRFEAMLAMDPGTGRLDITKGVMNEEATHFDFGMTVDPPGEGTLAWRLAGQATGAIGPERPGELPIAFRHFGFAARVLPAERQIVFDQVSAEGPEVDFHMAATLQATDAGFWVKSAMQMGRMPGHAVIRLWPSFVAAPVRAWFLRNLKGGTVDGGHGEVYLTDVDLETMRHQHSVPDDHVRIDFGVSNAAFTFMDGVPPLRGLDGTGVVTGDTFTLKATKAEMEVAQGQRLAASEGVFAVASTDPKPTPAAVTLRVAGGIDALAALLSRDALKPFADLPIDTAAVAGAFDGKLAVNFRIGSRAPKDDTTIAVGAAVRDFSIAKVIGKEALQNASLTVTADRTGIHAKGEGRMFGAPAGLELHKPVGGAPSEAGITLTLDDAARQKAGFGLGRSVTGTMTAKITTQLPASDKTRAAVQLDFTRCAFDAPIPGLRKAVNRPAKATFTIATSEGRSQLDAIAFDSGSTAIRGSAVLDADGDLVSASLSQVRLSPGDDARVDLSRNGTVLKVVARGTNLDARPFLKAATGGDTGGGGDGPVKDVDLDLHANILTGQNAQALTNVDLKLMKRGGQVRRLQIAGRLGRGAITATTTMQGTTPTVVISAKDAGALLSYLDLYNRMDGGQLDASLRFGDKGIDGTTQVHRFTIREDPSIKRLAEETPVGDRNGGAKINPSEVGFTKLEAAFTRVGGKVEVRQGAMFGPQLGATVEGTIDFAHDKVALNGTFVPLYGLNNLFSQIPVVGLLLGGGAHEGLFALNYKITGSASAPVLSFNPLSALAPGFLRKIFGAIDDAAQQGLDPEAGAGGQAPGRSASPPVVPAPN